MSNKIKTCVIGSYPTEIDNDELIKNYYNSNPTIWNKYIKSAVEDMVNAKINMISDGQTRDPFIQIYTRKLKGCRIRNRTEIINKIEYEQPITVEDQKYVKTIIPKNTEIIGLITGPFTLTKSCVDLHYNNEEKIAFDFAKALKQEAKNLEAHVDLISIDEPFFSNEMPKYAKELIHIITKNLHIPTRLHSCGDVSKIIPELLDLPVDILSHEFKLTPTLFDAFKNYDITKKICLGSVRSDNTTVETVDEIVEHIKKGINIFDKKICQISPDCGLRMMPRNIAYQKLQNLSKAGEKINA